MKKKSSKSKSKSKTAKSTTLGNVEPSTPPATLDTTAGNPATATVTCPSGYRATSPAFDRTSDTGSLEIVEWIPMGRSMVITMFSPDDDWVGMTWAMCVDN